MLRHAEMDIARELSNKTLEQDKGKLAGLLDTPGAQDAEVPAVQAAESFVTLCCGGSASTSQAGRNERTTQTRISR